LIFLRKLILWVLFSSVVELYASGDSKPLKLKGKEDSAAVADVSKGKQLFETHCKLCHSLELPKSQRLSKSDWSWVVADMKKKYGMTWLNKTQRQEIVDYLAVTYRPRKGKKRRKVW